MFVEDLRTHQQVRHYYADYDGLDADSEVDIYTYVQRGSAPFMLLHRLSLGNHPKVADAIRQQTWDYMLAPSRPLVLSRGATDTPPRMVESSRWSDGRQPAGFGPGLDASPAHGSGSPIGYGPEQETTQLKF